MISITVKNLLDAASSGALNHFFAIDKPVAVAWKNRRQIAACNEELKLYEERRLALCKKYGTMNDEMSKYVFTEENKRSFTTALNELFTQVVEIPGDPVKVSDLSAPKSPTRLSDNDLAQLEPFLID
jgi:hypothetical protein